MRIKLGFGVRDPGLVGYLRVAMMLLAIGACGRTERAGPPIPFDEPGACPFQCCTYREWSVDWGTDIRSDKRDDAPVAFHVAVNDTVTALTGVVTTTKVGRATASRQVNVGTNHVPVPAGQPIYLIRNVGSGDWKIWIDGQTDEQYIGSPPYCASGNQTSDACALTVTEQPENVWWVNVRDALGREGWTREVDHFGNIDACG
jgi:hypothetical protein